MFILKRPEVTSKLGAIKENKVIVNKCVNASFMMLAGFYFYHLWAFLLFAADANIRGISVIAQVATLTLLFAITKSKPQEILKYVILTLLIGLVASVAIAYACFISAAVILYHIKTGMHNNYLIIVACLCYLGSYLVPWQGIGNDLPMLPGFSSPSTILFGLYIILIAVIFRNIAAISIVLLALAYLCFKVLYPLLPSTELAQGSLIIASGFAVLITGLAINWKLRSDQNETR